MLVGINDKRAKHQVSISFLIEAGLSMACVDKTEDLMRGAQTSKQCFQVRSSQIGLGVLGEGAAKLANEAPRFMMHDVVGAWRSLPNKYGRCYDEECRAVIILW